MVSRPIVMIIIGNTIMSEYGIKSNISSADNNASFKVIAYAVHRINLQ